MKTLAKRLTAMVLVASMLLCSLASCKMVGEPATTEDLLVRFAANPNNANAVADATVDLALTVAGYRMKIPITGHIEAADNSAHITADVDLTSFTDEKRTYDAYVDLKGGSIVAVVRDASKEGSSWNKAELDLSFSIDIPAIVDILSDAKFMRVSYDSDDQVCYELTLPATSVVGTVFGRGDVTTSFCEVNRDELEEMLGDSKLRVLFNKDCLVRSIALDADFTYEDKKTLPWTVAVDLDFAANIDGYGTVDSQAVATPASVRDSAVVTDDPFDIDGLAEQLKAKVNK